MNTNRLSGINILYVELYLFFINIDLSFILDQG